MALSQALRNEVILRVGHLCEYCGLAQEGQEATFHIDHIIPVVEKGTSEMKKLALACVACSLKKGARHWVPDPVTGQPVRLFHPREDAWSEHFRLSGTVVEGVTARSMGGGVAKAVDDATGRAMVEAIEIVGKEDVPS